jgi:Replication-relaxation
MTYRFRAACATLRLDPGHLPIRDRAVLRILNRARVATAAQLAVLAYRSRYTAQVRLRRLWDAGYLERIALPRAGGPGGTPYAYRLSSACRVRLGYGPRISRGPAYLAHTLDAVDAVCALVGSGEREATHPVSLWLPESIVGDALPDGPVPDAVVVLDTPSGSGVLCLETDEATQNVAPIRAKLAAYHRSLAGRQGWHVLFVVPSPARRAWFARVGRADDVRGLSVGVVLRDELRRVGLDATVTMLPTPCEPTRLRALLDDQRRRAGRAPVASRAWLELLGSGGGESGDGMLG